MGTIKREYSLYNFDSNVKTTRTVRETLKYSPFAKTCSIAMDIAHHACIKVRSALTERKEIDCELITQEMHKLIDKYLVPGYFDQIGYPDNLPGNIKFFYYPKIEGGDNYNSHVKAFDKNENVGFDIIQISAGMNYKSYYSNYVRTLLINPTEQIKIAYSFSLLIKRTILYNLRDGAELCKVYESVISVAENQSPYYAKHLKKEFGFALSHILEDDLVINSETKGIAKYGMTFSMNVNLIDLKEGNRAYNICSSDTVLVRKNDPAELLTLFQRTQFNTIIQVDNYRKP